MADDVKIIDHGIFVKKSGNTKYIINPDLSNATVTTDNGKSYTTLNNALSSLDLAIDHPTIVEGLDKITDESKDGIYFVGNITETYTEEEIANLYSNNISYKLITDTDRNAYKVISEQTNANRYLEHTKLYITDNTSLYFPTDVTYPLYFTSDLTDDKTKCIQKCIDSNNTEYVRTNTGTKDDSGKITWTFGEWKTISGVPLASTDSLGVVQVGDNLSIDRYGVLRVDTSAYNVYLDGVNGLDTNDGLTADTPVKTVTRAFQCFSGVSRYSPQPHVMYVAAGTYTDAAFSVNGMIHPPMMINFAPGAQTISNVGAVFGGQAVISGSLTVDNTGHDIRLNNLGIGARQSGKLYIVNMNAIIRGNFDCPLYSSGVSIVYDYDYYKPFDSTINTGNTIHFDSVSSENGAAICEYTSLLYLAHTTCTGIVTGRKYYCDSWSNIVLHGHKESFPGSVEGSAGNSIVEFVY